jgi:hypothetical protein
MKMFIIERNLPGAGNMTPEELKAIAKTSNTVITLMGKPYKWLHSYVTENKIYCIHEADNEKDILEHASCGDFPANAVEEIKTIIGPTTAV